MVRSHGENFRGARIFGEKGEGIFGVADGGPWWGIAGWVE